ncbi:antibiotic biosynthesis monooxygenase [Aminobacter sp. DSM 101952]|uniref:putative quinol monooxygenase n=1 Tax=Aminobacter sp. DSM 101952 TaxID=2735891 RepID=UPI0006F6392F|nr:putative quinol monooxygenase [Aminobacter sp. DSM 101952]KQU75704.1 antibiotic biosynthesis monooxygenase [Aminobacter sp. DSM 101952]
MAEVHVLAILYAKEGKEEELRSDLTVVTESSRNEDGSIRYELFADQNDRRRFVIVEHWRDAAAQERHHNLSDHIRAFHENGDRNVERRELVCFMSRVT